MDWATQCFDSESSDRTERSEMLRSLPALSLLNMSRHLLIVAMSSRTSIHECDRLRSSLLDHSFDVARNASVFNRDVHLTQDLRRLFVLECHANGQHRVIVALLDVTQLGYPRCVIIDVPFEH